MSYCDTRKIEPTVGALKAALADVPDDYILIKEGSEYVDPITEVDIWPADREVRL